MTKPLTGRKVLCIALGAFGTIIAANMTLAIAAIGSFPGIEVKNGYIASQTFEAERAAQAELGWSVETAYLNGALTIELRDRTGATLHPDTLTARLGRPTGRAVDRTADLVPTTSGFAIPAALDVGLWRLDILAEHNGETFRQHLTIRVAQ